jgi:hypothetical protein
MRVARAYSVREMRQDAQFLSSWRPGSNLRSKPPKRPPEERHPEPLALFLRHLEQRAPVLGRGLPSPRRVATPPLPARIGRRRRGNRGHTCSQAEALGAGGCLR